MLNVIDCLNKQIKSNEIKEQAKEICFSKQIEFLNSEISHFSIEMEILKKESHDNSFYISTVNTSVEEIIIPKEIKTLHESLQKSIQTNSYDIISIKNQIESIEKSDYSNQFSNLSASLHKSNQTIESNMHILKHQIRRLEMNNI